MSSSPVPVRHNPAAHRFELCVDGQLCVAEYRLSGDHMIFTHTEVPAALQGRGLASRLVRAGVEYARAHHKPIIPECSYVATWLARHPENAPPE